MKFKNLESNNSYTFGQQVKKHKKKIQAVHNLKETDTGKTISITSSDYTYIYTLSLECITIEDIGKIMGMASEQNRVFEIYEYNDSNERTFDIVGHLHVSNINLSFKRFPVATSSPVVLSFYSNK